MRVWESGGGSFVETRDRGDEKRGVEETRSRGRGRTCSNSSTDHRRKTPARNHSHTHLRRGICDTARRVVPLRPGSSFHRLLRSSFRRASGTPYDGRPCAATCGCMASVVGNETPPKHPHAVPVPASLTHYASIRRFGNPHTPTRPYAFPAPVSTIRHTASLRLSASFHSKTPILKHSIPAAPRLAARTSTRSARSCGRPL